MSKDAVASKTIKMITPDVKQVSGYPKRTGRFLHVGPMHTKKSRRVAFVGDSTIDNSYWVEKTALQSTFSDDTKQHYIAKSTVTYQTALAHLEKKPDVSMYFSNLAVDGATSEDISQNFISLDKVLPTGWDHPKRVVRPLTVAETLQPDTVILSVGGNDYREALGRELKDKKGLDIPEIAFYDNFPARMNKRWRLVKGTLQLLFRRTPADAKTHIAEKFRTVQKQLIENYKSILDKIAKMDSVKRVVLSTQYYLGMNMQTLYFIYTGFSHLANAQGKDTDSFTLMKSIMDELYGQVYQHALSIAKKHGKEIVIADMTSSINPLGGNHVAQIEPNARGAKTMGEILSEAINLESSQLGETSSAILSKNPRTGVIENTPLNDKTMKNGVRSIHDFIDMSRFNHWIPDSMSAFYDTTTNFYYLFAGRRFDTKVSKFDPGILDVSIITVLATYAWQYCLNMHRPLPLRIVAGFFSAPIVLTKSLASMAITMACSPLIILFQVLKSSFSPSPISDPVIPNQQEMSNLLKALIPPSMSQTDNKIGTDTGHRLSSNDNMKCIPQTTPLRALKNDSERPELSLKTVNNTEDDIEDKEQRSTVDETKVFKRIVRALSR